VVKAVKEGEVVLFKRTFSIFKKCINLFKCVCIYIFISASPMPPTLPTRGGGKIKKEGGVFVERKKE